MPAPRKPKKVFIQFAIALVIAAVLGIGALVIGFTVIQGAVGKSNQLQKDLEQQKQELEAERVRMDQEKQQAAQIPVTYTLVQAKADLQPGEPITQDSVERISTDQPPEPGAARQLSDVVGKMVKTAIYKGEPVLQGKLLDSSGMVTIDPGMRAITIQVDSIGGLSGALTPGVHVDILTTVSHEDKTVTRTILQNVPVISVGGNSGGGASLPPALAAAASQAASAGSGSGLPVTMAVTPKQAEMLTLANELGKFHLTLRNFADKKTASVGGSDLTELMTGISAAGARRNLPKLPPEPLESGFHNVNYSPGGSLPAPGMGAEKSDYVMKIYKGSQEPAEVKFKQ